MEENIQRDTEEIMRLVRVNKELTKAKQCPKNDSMA
jgi:hypothetical protein